MLKTMHQMKFEIDRRVQLLVGLPLSIAGRAVDMVTFGFGRTVEEEVQGKTLRRAEVSLHIQCPWRIVREDAILVGYGDWRYPPTGLEIDAYDFKAWDEPRNRRDELVDAFIAHGPLEHIVKRTESAATGDLCVFFADRCVLGVYPNSATHEDGYDEYWRLLPPGPESPHFVVTAHGIEA